MYDSLNLPLSKNKIIKKTIGSSGILPMLISLVFLGVIIFFQTSVSPSIDGKILFYSFLVCFIPSLIALGISIVYQYVYYKYYFYRFEEDTAEIRKGVISRSTGHVRYGKIQNIYVDQDWLDRLLGLYDVHYETAGETSGIYSHVDGLVKENADKLTAFLNEKVLHMEPQKFTNSVGIQESTGTGSQKIFSRENIPLEKKVIISNTILLTFSFSLIIFILTVTFSDVAISILGTALMTVAYVAIIPVTFIGALVYELVWFQNFSFTFDETGGVITEKVISVKNTHVYFNRIQNITVTQSIVERILGLHTIRIETASEGTAKRAITITGLKKENAEALNAFLLEKTKKYQSV